MHKHRVLRTGVEARTKWRSQMSATIRLSSRASSLCLRYFAFVSGVLLCSAATAQPQNPVAVENTRPGTTDWVLTNPTTADGQLEGYASATSVNRGESITFY